VPRRSCGVVKSGPAPAVVPDTTTSERDGAVELRRLRVGARVRILGNPFHDQLGLCTGMTGRERVLVLLDVLGAQRQVRLSQDAIEPV
jgi:hypothetical protein